MKKLKRYRFWSKEKVIESALKYENKVGWLNNDPTAYSLAHEKGWLKEATKHMKSAKDRINFLEKEFKTVEKKVK